jgi:transposase
MPSPLFPELPELPETPGAAPAPEPAASPRITRPERLKVKLRPLALDALLAPDHQARLVWRYVAGLDLSALEGAVKSVEGHAGRAAIDPHLLLALWLFATLDGIGSARQIERLCEEHLAYLWLRGDVHVGRSVLAEFRVGHEALLDELLTKSVATLREKGLVTLERVSQDGIRIRASAGAGSFRRRDSLERALAEASAQVIALKGELDADPASSERRRTAAQLRGAADREARLAAALTQMPEIEQAWARNQKKHGKKERKGRTAKTAAGTTADDTEPAPAACRAENADRPAEPTPTRRSAPRASMTDSEARIMKMANSGFRPAFNCQIAADVDSLVVVAVDTCNVGSDAGLHAPLIADVQKHFGVTPTQWLVDGGFPTLASIEGMPDGCDFIGPVPEPKDSERDRYAALPDDTPKVAAWRVRMGTDAAKAAYRLRGATSECVNAHMRNRRLRQMPVRGIRRSHCVLLLHAIAHNLVRADALERKAVAA